MEVARITADARSAGFIFRSATTVWKTRPTLCSRSFAAMMISVFGTGKAHQITRTAARNVLPDFFGSDQRSSRNRSRPNRSRRSARASTRRWCRLSRHGLPFSLTGTWASLKATGSVVRAASASAARSGTTGGPLVVLGETGGEVRRVAVVLDEALQACQHDPIQRVERKPLPLRRLVHRRALGASARPALPLRWEDGRL